MEETTNVVQVATETAAELAVSAVEETKSMLHLDELSKYLTWENLAKVVTSVIAILIFWIVYRVIKHVVKKNASKKLQKRTVSLITKAISYCFYVIITMYILGLFGIKLSAIWGAAGIAGVALGFAAQTSVSNLISGLFVLTEKTMKIGDFIEVDGVSGTIDSVGLLAVKIHTINNQLIRIPNSTIINTKLMNYSSYNYRRYVFDVSVDYSSDLDKTLEVMKKVPSMCPTVILDKEDYAPSVIYTTLGDSGINMNIIVWCERSDFAKTKNDICMNVVKACNEANINIPFNRMDVSILK